MNFSLVNPSVPEFPNSDFFIPDFSLRRKKKSPACKGGIRGGFFRLSADSRCSSRNTQTRNPQKNTNHLCCFFSPRSQAYLLQLCLLPTTVFSASSTVVRFLHCIPQVQALKVLTYDKRLFVSSIRIYRQSRPRTMTTPNIYHHMGKLVQAKFVNTRIDRNRNYYSFNKNYINQLLDELKGILRC